MKRCVAVMLFTAALLGASQASAAETRTIGVEGVGAAPIASTATSAEANAAYRQAMAAAIADGLEKAEFLAAKTGAKVEEIDLVKEGGGSIECRDADGSYAEYAGAQADFGYSQVSVVAPEASAPSGKPTTASPNPARKKHKKKKKKPKAIRAAAASCTVSAQVSLTYFMAPAPA